MGCDGCELWPTNKGLQLGVVKELQAQFPESPSSSFKMIVADAMKDYPATELWKHQDAIIKIIFAGLPASIKSAANPKSVISKITGAYKEPFKCYAGRLHLVRGGNKGYAPAFETVTEFAAKCHDLARATDLKGKPRIGRSRKTKSGKVIPPIHKTWLNGLPRLIFVSDMGDALSKDPKRNHEPDTEDNYNFAFLKREIIDVAQSIKGSRHVWLWLTKRPGKMAHFSNQLHRHNVEWPDNLVAMTSVTSRSTVNRVEKLKKVRSKYKGVSVEPLWESINLNLEGIDWCIVGGESGPSAKPFDLGWARSIRDDCAKTGTALFVKQLGKCPVENGQPLDLSDSHGGNWDEWPKDLQLRGIPEAFYKLGSTGTSFVVELVSLAVSAEQKMKSLQDHSLSKLAGEIEDYHLQAVTKASEAREIAANAVECAMESGFRLLAANERIKHGGFGTWLAEQCTKISAATAYRYMSLAEKFSHVINAGEITTLRLAYIACGILPAPEERTESAGKKVPGIRGLSNHVKAISHYWHAKIQKTPLEKWAKADRLKLKKELSALADILSSLDEV